MIIKKILIFLLIPFSLICNVSAQTVSLQNIDYPNPPQVNYVFNRIFNGSLDLLYQKMLDVKKNDSGIVTIVHIGDSHIQADFFSGIVRKGLQKDFGNAGRGLVFPYQLARSNAPADISSSSNTGWRYNRLAHPEIPLDAGVSGFCIKTATPGATINLYLKPDENGSQSFKKIKFFIDDDSSSIWTLKADSNDYPYTIDNYENDSMLYHEVQLKENVNSFTLSLLSGGKTHSFYGADLENEEAGILYHTIGVNGATYAKYNTAPLFWQQLSGLKANLFIISLGTNDAQGNFFNDADFINQVSIFLKKLRIASPDAAVLITIPADSYKRGRPNAVLKQLNASLYNYCSKNNIPTWDLYRITNGYGSARYWAQKGLMNYDKVHFTSAGYRIQGQLLLNALQKGYNNYISTDQNLR